MSEAGWIGKTLLGRYQITQLLGQGGMAEVYKGHDPNLGRAVAVKLIHRHLASDPGFLGRFEREAQAIARLRHPNIVQVYDFNHEGDVYFMIMEYIDGPTLHDRLRELSGRHERLPLAEAVGLMIKLADAMHYAHSTGMVHRDLKPSNIMFTGRGEPVIADFGLARIVGMTSYTATGAVMGTPLYMAPEQGKGEGGSERSDIYALGVILYEMVTGEVPFTGDTPISVMLKHITEPLPSPQALNPNLPPLLVGVIETALAKDPASRFPSAETMSLALSTIRPQLAARPPSAEATLPVARPSATVIELPPRPPTAGPAPLPSPALQPPTPTPPPPAASPAVVPQPSTMATPAPLPPVASPSPAVAAESIPRVPPSAPPAAPASQRSWITLAAIAGVAVCLIAVVAGAILAGPALTGSSGKATATSQIITAPTDSVATPIAATGAAASTDAPAPTATIATTPTTPSTASSAPEGMVEIPAGEFIRGSDSSNADIRPQRTITLKRFFIDRTEVTNVQFATFVEETGYVTHFEQLGRTRNIWSAPATGVSASDRPDHPVVQVTWADAHDYCHWADKRLPTEAEWEKAARGTEGFVFPWGNDFDAAKSNSTLNPNSPHTTMPVGSFPDGASPFGALDMSGNVWELVGDLYSATYFALAPDIDPPGPSEGANRVLRGGGWINDKELHLSAIFRDQGTPDFGDESTGFRCAMDAP